MESHIFITDKSGKKFWNTSVTFGQHQGELRNMQRRLAHDIHHVAAIDVATARIEMTIDGRVVSLDEPADNISDDELLRELGL